MERPKRVLCLMDLSIVGRASLACVPTVLGACGVQCCPFPASVLSTHTGGFDNVQILDLAQFGLPALEHIAAQGTEFDAIYVGYMNSPEQFRLAQRAMECYTNSFVVVDPAVGDDGTLYAGITKETVQSMRALCSAANLITPNLTESALMVGEDPKNWKQSDVQNNLAGWAKQGVSVLVTGVPKTNRQLAVFGQEAGQNEAFVLELERQDANFPGTGDLFASAVTALLLQGFTLQNAAQTAADFITKALCATLQGKGAIRQGIWYEPFLWRLGEMVYKGC